MGLTNLYSRDLCKELVIPTNPNKVTSLAPSITEVIIELGLSSKLYAVSSWCKILGIAKGYEELIAKPLAGDYVRLNRDIVRNSDLILLSGGAQAKNLINELELLRTPYYVVTLPRSIGGIIDLILEVSGILGVAERGISLVYKFIDEIPSLRKTFKNVNAIIELNLGIITLPGLYSHITSGLELLGLNVLNKYIIKPYIWGHEAEIMLRSILKEHPKVNVVLHEEHKLYPKSEEVINEVKKKYGRVEVLVLPIFTLSDYGPRFIDGLKYITNELLKIL